MSLYCECFLLLLPVECALPPGIGVAGDEDEKESRASNCIGRVFRLDTFLTLATTRAYTATRGSLMQHVIVAIALALAVLAEPQDTQRTPRASDKRTRDIYVSVVDGSGKAVTGLTAEDFTVEKMAWSARSRAPVPRPSN